jgi:CheY-like chemotaxis protein
MTEPDKVRILAVDDHEGWRYTLGEGLAALGLEHEVVGDTDTAVERLQTGAFTGVITDGLDGDWTRVVEAAREAGTAPVLVSADEAALAIADEDHIPAFDKGRYNPSDTLGKLVKIIVAEQAAAQ